MGMTSPNPSFEYDRAARFQCGAQGTHLALQKILDDDAQVFVVKLWRMLCFEMFAAKAVSG